MLLNNRHARHIIQCPPTNSFSQFFPKILLFLKKNLFNNKICSTRFHRLSLKNGRTPPPPTKNSFLQFPQKILLFLKKFLNKKIFSILFVIKKGYIHFWCKMTPYRLHSDLAAVLQTSPVQSLLLCLEIPLFWHTSCATDFCIGISFYSDLSSPQYSFPTPLTIRRIFEQQLLTIKARSKWSIILINLQILINIIDHLGRQGQYIDTGVNHQYFERLTW